MIEAERPAQGLRRPPADRGPLVLAPARRHRRRHRRQRRGQDDAVPDDRRQEQPDAARCALGDTVDLAYVDQSRDALDPDKTVWEEISDGYDKIKVGDREIASRAYVAGSTSRAPTSSARSACSRAASATASTSPSCCAAAATCCCSTSRPTTSTSTRCARSRRRCSPSPGCAVVISHDRWFLDRVATHVLAFEGDSQVVWFEGNFEAYEEHRRERLGAEADRPHRITYKKLVRA